MFFRIKLFSRLGGCASQLVRKLFEEAREYASSILCRESGKISDKSHNWRKIAISLIDPDFGEQTAQACAIACLHQLRATILWRKAYRAIVALGEKLKIQRSARNNSMAISVSTSVLAFGGTGWESVGGQLLASGVLLLSGYQDIGLRARIGAVFGFFMALAFGISALGTAVWARLWGGTAICAAVLCFETWLILRWWRRRTSA